MTYSYFVIGNFDEDYKIIVKKSYSFSNDVRKGVGLILDKEG